MSDVNDRVKKIVVEHLGVDESKVTENASFIDDLGADSLDTVELVMAFEEEFGCEIPDDAADSDRTAEEDNRKTGAKQQQPNWPKQIRGIVTEVEQKADGWMITVKGIHYWTRVKPFADQLRAARGREAEFSAEIGKGPDGERCPVITKIFSAVPPAPGVNTPPPTPAAPPLKAEAAKPATSSSRRKEELF